MILAYDIELYPNYILVGIIDKKRRIYKTTNLNDIAELFSKRDMTFVGFNNHYYDDHIISRIINGERDIKVLHALGNRIIKSKSNERVEVPYTSIDLMVFTGKVSLKYIEIELGMENIIELPIEPNTILTDDEKLIISDYLDNDLLATWLLYEREVGAINARFELLKIYPDLSKTLFYDSNAGLAEKCINIEYRKLTGLKISNSSIINRHHIDFKKIVFDFINFKNPHNKKILNDLLSIESATVNTGDYDEMIKMRELMSDKFEEKNFKFKTNCLEHSFKLGGLHSITHKGYRTGKIYNIDVSSYYPNLMIQHDIRPGLYNYRFIEILQSILTTRLFIKGELSKLDKSNYEYKDLKNKDAALKIIINSLFGKTGSYGKMLDFHCMYSVTVNGQLLLIMLAEALEERGFEVIMSNTDGLLIIDPDDIGVEALKTVMNEWELISKCKLDMDEPYTHYISINNNDYCLIRNNKIVKSKGAILAGGKKTAPAITKMVHDYFINNLSPDESIKSLNDKDYLFSVKVQRNNAKTKTLAVLHNDVKVQYTNRVYYKTDGYPLLKMVEKTGKISTDAIISENIGIANNINDISNINYDYYKKKAIEVIDSIQNGEFNKNSSEFKLVKDVIKLTKLGFIIVDQNDNVLTTENLQDFINFNTELYISFDTDKYYGFYNNFGKNLLNENISVFTSDCIVKSDLFGQKVKYVSYKGGAFGKMSKKSRKILNPLLEY